ncbi:sialin-like [Plodia interpunctella]|uniref:sialin-like n=1 Tax=Plodia interpunctella TaxID=58824 RepID=UPI002367AEFA|nr:sialin-like [Plodia interpunctella]
MLKIRVRVIIGVMIFLGYFLIYNARYNLSVHIVDLVQLTKREEDGVYNDSNILRTAEKNAHVMELLYWSDMKVAKLFSAYHIGYFICFPIFHNWGDRIGPTWVVGIAGMTSGTMTCLTPMAAYFSFWSVFFLRIITGFCAGAMQPSMVQVLRDWVPPIERNHFMWAYCGITMGTFCTFLICAGVHYYSHWPVGFYIIGGMQLTWSAVWISIVADCPQRHPFISKEELTYLRSTIGCIFPIKLANAHTPWKSIVRSVPFWALCTLNFGYAWIIIALCLHGPFYYSKVVGYNIYQAAVLTALPFLLRFILGTIVIQVYHWYKYNTEIKRIKHMRKYFVIVSHVIPGIIIAICWLLPVVPGPVLLTIAIALTAAGMDITLDLCYDLTPTFVNSINTVIKIIGNTSGIIVSLGVGDIINKYKNTLKTWKDIWCFHAMVLLASGVVFLIWGNTHVQPWNSLRVRRPVLQRVQPKVSIMSNIIEVEEEESA